MKVIIEMSDEDHERFLRLGGVTWLSGRLKAVVPTESQMWLRLALMSGPREVNDLYAQALMEGISQARLRRARTRMALPRARRGWGKGARMFWGLPGTLEDRYGK